jgi:hypothetical protein
VAAALTAAWPRARREVLGYIDAPPLELLDDCSVNLITGSPVIPHVHYHLVNLDALLFGKLTQWSALPAMMPWAGEASSRGQNQQSNDNKYSDMKASRFHCLLLSNGKKFFQIPKLVIEANELAVYELQSERVLVFFELKGKE